MITKKELRKLYKSIRSSVSESEKNAFDSRIFTYLVNSDYYKNCRTVLIYVSVGTEADTYDIINRAVDDGKIVAVPRCDKGEMNFFRIYGTEELVIGNYGIPSVNPERTDIFTDFCNAICVVPALSYDKSAFRLGYGGGYYDKFLSKNLIHSIGLCYERCVCDSLPSEKHDITVNCILTENGFRKL